MTTSNLLKELSSGIKFRYNKSIQDGLLEYTEEFDNDIDEQKKNVIEKSEHVGAKNIKDIILAEIFKSNKTKKITDSGVHKKFQAILDGFHEEKRDHFWFLNNVFNPIGWQYSDQGIFNEEDEEFEDVEFKNYNTNFSILDYRDDDFEDSDLMRLRGASVVILFDDTCIKVNGYFDPLCIGDVKDVHVFKSYIAELETTFIAKNSISKDFLDSFSLRDLETFPTIIFMLNLFALNEDVDIGEDIEDIEDVRIIREQIIINIVQKKSKKKLQKLIKIATENDFLDIVLSSLPRDMQLKVISAGQTTFSENKKRKRAYTEEEFDENATYRERLEKKQEVPKEAYEKAVVKCKEIEKSGSQGDGKAEKYMDMFLKIPFGKDWLPSIIEKKEAFLKECSKVLKKNIEHERELKEFTENKKIKSLFEDYVKEKQNFLVSTRKILDDSVTGHDDAKLQIERLIAQWITGERKGMIVGIQGPPGNGKTTLIKEGVAKCLVGSNGKPYPSAFIPVGGIADASSLNGHHYTYTGSEHGKIVDSLIKAKCSNPILLFDEIDKCKPHGHGSSAWSVLQQITDPAQNQEFCDEYFSGVPIDLSKCIIFVTFNDASKVDPVLLDRIPVIRTNALRITEKMMIASKFMIPEISKQVGFANNVAFSDEALHYLINNYTFEAGARNMKALLEEVIREYNRKILLASGKIPELITKKDIEELFDKKRPIKFDKIHSKPVVGLMNGLYATAAGIGGLTPIQSTRTQSKQDLEILLTGNQGDVMKESMKCAFTVAWSLLSEEEKQRINEEGKKNPQGIHMHCPDGGTPKDGPSAGGAITTTIYSLLTGKLIRNDVAMTGEIDLQGKITEIGGLVEKLNGARVAGVKKVLIPEENNFDLQKGIKEGYVKLDKNFEVICVNNIKQVLKHVIVEEKVSKKK